MNDYLRPSDPETLDKLVKFANTKAVSVLLELLPPSRQCATYCDFGAICTTIDDKRTWYRYEHHDL